MKAFQTLDTEAQGFLTQEQLSKLMMEEGDHILMKLIVSLIGPNLSKQIQIKIYLGSLKSEPIAVVRAQLPLSECLPVDCQTEFKHIRVTQVYPSVETTQVATTLGLNNIQLTLSATCRRHTLSPPCLLLFGTN